MKNIDFILKTNSFRDNISILSQSRIYLPLTTNFDKSIEGTLSEFTQSQGNLGSLGSFGNLGTQGTIPKKVVRKGKTFSQTSLIQQNSRQSSKETKNSKNSKLSKNSKDSKKKSNNKNKAFLDTETSSNERKPSQKKLNSGYMGNKNSNEIISVKDRDNINTSQESKQSQQSKKSKIEEEHSKKAFSNSSFNQDTSSKRSGGETVNLQNTQSNSKIKSKKSLNIVPLKENEKISSRK